MEILELKNTIMKELDSTEKWKQWKKESENLKTEQQEAFNYEREGID